MRTQHTKGRVRDTNNDALQQEDHVLKHAVEMH